MNKKNIAIALLASGESKRFNGIKLLATIHQQSLLSLSLQALQVLNLPLFVILGAHREEIAPTLDSNIIINERYAHGISSSILTASEQLYSEYSYNAILFCLADQPFIPAQHYQNIINIYQNSTCDIVATEYSKNDKEIVGNPALFSNNCYDDLMSLQGDKGAKSLIMSKQYKTRTVLCQEAKYDIDTREDLELIKQKLS